MRYTHVAGVAGAALLASVALAGGNAGAQEIPLSPLDVSPTSGPAGTTITVSGGSCATTDEGLEPVAVAFVFLWDGELNDEDILNGELATPEADGSWTTSFTFPDGHDPEATYLVSGFCVGEAADPANNVLLADYDAYDFDLTGPPPTEPPVVTPPDLPPAAPVEPSDSPAPAPVATPVPGDPNVTG